MDSWQSHVLSGHLLSLNAEASMRKGASVHVGVVDSLFLEPGDRDDVEIVRGRDCVTSDERDTTGHGMAVFDVLQYTAPDATFSCYRTVVDGGAAKRSNVAEAIYAASRNGVDVLNLSLGVCHAEEDGHHCGGLCRIADEARLAVEEDDVTIVAATGNDRTADAVTCPALVADVVGVGGYVAACGEEIDRSGSSSQYWVDAGEFYGPLCGQRGCRSGQECDDNRREKPWDGNVSFHNAVPDVLAPVVRATRDDGHLSLQAGTSFAAPLVAGRVATVTSDLRSVDGQDPGPDAIRRGLMLTGVELDDGQMTKYDEAAFYRHLRESRDDR